MPIRSGIGFGEAQVFDTSNLINTFGKIVAQQQKESARYQEELADIVSSVKIDGIRDADKADVAKYYDEIKNLYRTASTSRNNQERAIAKSLVKEKINSINEFSKRSQDFDKRLASLSEKIAPNVWAYDPKKVEQIRSLKDMPLTSIGSDVSLDPFDYLPMMDDSVRDKEFEGIYKSEKERIGPKNYIKESIAGTGERYVGVGDKNRVINDIASKIATSPKYRALAYSQFTAANPDNPAPDIEDVIDSELKIYEQKHGYRYEGGISAKPSEKSGDTAIVGLDAPKPKRFFSDEKRVKDASGKTKIIPGGISVDFDSFVSVNPQPFSLPQLGKRLNITTGQWESYRGSGNVEIVGVGKRPRGGEYNIVIKDKDGFEYMINEDDLPVGVRNDKTYQAARSVVYTPKPTKAKRTEIKESEIPAMAKSANYSVAEYTKELQKKGIKIIK